MNSSGMKITDIAAKSAQPWRRSRTSSPRVKHSPAPISRIDITSTKFESGVGFSSGWAEFAL